TRHFVRRASFVLIENRCGSIPGVLKKDFQLAATRKRFERIPKARESRKDRWEIWRRVKEDPTAPEIESVSAREPSELLLQPPEKLRALEKNGKEIRLQRAA